jgi:hypothetical protein
MTERNNLNQTFDFMAVSWMHILPPLGRELLVSFFFVSTHRENNFRDVKCRGFHTFDDLRACSATAKLELSRLKSTLELLLRKFFR